MKYNPALDGLRALSVLAVVLAHAGLSKGGGRGVDVFFVLSGFLITSNLLAEAQGGRIAVLGFWRRRVLRLVPALATMVTIYLLLCPLLLPQMAATRWGDASLAMTYTINYAFAMNPWPTGIDHTWSLAVEAQFYLIWPLLLPWLVRRQDPVLWLLGAWAAVAAWRFIDVEIYHSWDHAYYPTHLHASGLLLGAALALRSPSPWVGWFGAAGICLVLVTDGNFRWTIPLTEISAAGLIAGLLQPSILQRLFSWRPAVYLGIISYGVYLWQTPVLLVLGHQEPGSRVLLGLSISVAFATISYVTVERWGLELGRRRNRRVALSDLTHDKLKSGLDPSDGRRDLRSL